MLNLTVSKWRKSRLKKINWPGFLFFFFVSSLAQAASPLSDHPSPYVRLHANDAVKWQIWNKDILSQARKKNKLIFISIGYYACHWCHVMRDESFNDDDVAEVINNKYIPVKIDRELNPALDDYLMNFTQLTRGHGGWPLNVFLTPNGYPLVGLVYLPKTDFLQLTQKLSIDWQSNQDELDTLAANAFEFSRAMLYQSQKMPSIKKLKEMFNEHIEAGKDELLGGMGGQAKFPQPALLMALLKYYEKTKDESVKEFVLLTLDQIAAKGLHDVIGGGFFRYAVDPMWHLPHFEKMLYTNAGLVHVFVKAFELFKENKYLDIAIETVEFMQREMWNGKGFVSSLSAQDSHGEEGGSYVWQLNNLRKKLTTQEWNKINRLWEFVEVEQTGGMLPVGLALDDQWKNIKEKLYSKRATNPSPVDEKILLSWNGYALSALAAVVKVVDRKDFKQLGNSLADILKVHAEEGIVRTVKGVEQHYLEDYAYVVQGLMDWEQVFNKTGFMKPAKDLVRKAHQLFADGQGWRLSDENILPMPGDQIAIPDAQLPSSQVVLLRLIRRLEMEQEPSMKILLTNNLATVDARMLQNSIGFASHVIFQMEYGIQ